MVAVRLWGSLEAFADGKSEVEIAASNMRELLDGLATAYPDLK